MQSPEHREMGVETLRRATLTSIFILATSFTTLAQTPSVVKVDPPSWWANHSINPVRVLIRGRNLGGARLKSVSANLRFSNVKVNANSSYIFADLSLGRVAKPGKYSFTVETTNGKTTVPFSIEEARAGFQGITNDDVIYLIMIDRFADGDSSNNAPAGSPREANDRQNPRAFHGGDLRGVINQLTYLKDLGVTAFYHYRKK